MKMNGMMGILYNFCQWITRLVYLNILWGVFSLIGLGIFGLFPATAAMFAVVRQWVMGDEEIPVYKTFWAFYKKEFWKSNLLGLMLSVIGYLLYIDIIFQQAATGPLKLLTLPLIIVTILFILMSFYVFPIFVHYDITIWKVLKNSILFMIMHPLVDISMAAVCYIAIYIMKSIPGLIPVLGGSSLSYVIMAGAYFVFKKNQRKQETALSK